ncbi:hypothetical protein RMATCC62417_15338 [Rhizopus microsporus]|nr:hypothetical protein RMATCC62417_15338 [Rhizopus microsporus]
MNNENKLRLFIDKSFNYSIIQPTSPSDAIPHKLLDPLHDKFSIQYSNDEIYRYQLNLKPQSVMVRDCLLAVDCGSINHFPCIWSRFIDICFFSQQELNTLSTPDHEWKSFLVALLSSLAIRRRKKRGYLERKKRRLSYKISSASNAYLSDDTPIPTKWIERAIELSETSDSPKLPLPAFVEIVHNLHVIYEEYRIKKPTFMHAKTLGYLLLQCAVLLRSDDWIRYYENQDLQTELVHSLEVADEDIRENMTEPASIQACLREITPKNSSKPTLLRSFGVNTLEPALYYYANTYARTTKSLWTIYGALYDTSSDAASLLNRIVSEGVTRHTIDMLEESIAAPILDVLNKFKSHPAFDWPKEAYILVGRNDIYKQLEAKVVVCDPNIDTFKLASREAYEHVASLDELMKDQVALNDECMYKSDIMDMQTEHFRFGFDGLVKKVRIMLDASRIPEHHVSERTDISDDELTIEYQEQVLIIAQRTLALAAGRGIYAFGTHIPDLTKVLPFETIVLSAKILPLRTIVALESEYITSEMLIWPQFHNGVAAGLRIAPNNEIDDSWINFCSPAELTPEHGGMLLAMGLNGALKRLPFGHWVRFFSHTYEPVSLGFILGAAVAYRGTRHSKVTKILSVHIPSLLPDGGHSFNYSNMIIATSLLGMGLVYSKSCDRLMVTVMLQELGKNAYSDPSTLSPDYESCALAAGFALGFITLGSGNHLEALEDLQLRNRLYNLMSGRFVTATHGQHQQDYLQEDTDIPEMNASKDHLMNLDITSPGATIALGLMYLKTENKRVADHVDILETRPYLNYVRPDFLLIRVVAKNLIMWSTIMPTDTWIESQLPDFIVHPSAEEQEQHVKLDEEVSKQAMYNIICGSCLCLGLRYAGSKNKEALGVLLSRLDSFMKLSTLPDTTPQKRVTKCIVRTCIDVVCTAAAMVMAGSGDQQVFARLQQLYSRTTSEVSYGSHMAVSMALGLLFVGLGGYTLKTTDEAIAGLLCAFYPFYPINTEDNRYHLQVFRHLWALAIDSRWLIPFDVDHRQPCRLPMYLELYDDDGRASNDERRIYQVRIEAPSVVPDYSLIKSIRLDSNRYWPLFVDEKAGEYRESIIRSGIIYVKRKDGKLSYEEDPCGRSSLDM